MAVKQHRSVDRFLAQLWALEAQLVRAGFEPMPLWWRATIERFYRARKRRLVVRKGRRVYASTCVAPRLAVAEMLFGAHPHIHGSPPLVFAFLSVRRDEAAKRLRGVMAILETLGVKFIERGETVELRSRPAAFTVVTANHKTSVGDTLAFAWCDEVASWSDDALGANPAEEVVGRLAPALATLPDAKLFLVSSPLSVDDFHARQFDIGENAAQCVAFGATWTINPNLTEEDTHAEEPDQRRWLREWAAVPQAGISGAFEHALLVAAVRKYPRLRWSQPILALDPSSGGGCAFASACFFWGRPPTYGEPLDHTAPLIDEYGNDVTHVFEMEGSKVKRGPGGHVLVRADAVVELRPVLAVAEMHTFDPGWANNVALDQVVEVLAEKAHRAGARTIVGDGHLGPALEMEFKRHGLHYKFWPTNNTNKGAAVDRFRSLLAGRQIILPDDQALQSELLNFSEMISPSGAIRHGARAGTRSDRVSVVINALIAEAEGAFPWSPLWAGKRGRAGVPHEALG